MPSYTFRRKHLRRATWKALEAQDGKCDCGNTINATTVFVRKGKAICGSCALKYINAD